MIATFEGDELEYRTEAGVALYEAHHAVLKRPACSKRAAKKPAAATDQSAQEDDASQEESQEIEADEAGEQVEADEVEADEEGAQDEAAAKRPACHDHDVEDPLIDKASLKLQRPYPNGKCYIRHLQGGKKKSLVNLEKKACIGKSQRSVMKSVLAFIKKTPMCRKSQAVVEKRRLLDDKT